MFKNFGRVISGARRLATLFFVLALAMATPVFAAGYVGAELSDVKPEAKVVVANPQPVQVLFQFATKGAPNKAGTKFTKAEVLKTVSASGLFSQVSEAPTPNGAILSITIDNTVAPGAMTDAAAKGAVTGATLFLVGSNTRDYYTGTIEYVSGPTATKITRTANHSIVTQMGMINSAPADAVKVEGGLKGAIMTMVRQIVSNPLNAIASDEAFAPPVGQAPAPQETGPALSSEPSTAAQPGAATAPRPPVE